MSLFSKLNNYKYTYDIKNFNLNVLKEAIKEFMGDRPKTDLPKEEYVSPYIELTREEVLNLKNGDVCYIMSSYGMQPTTYPELDGDTHRNLFGKGGANKTVEEKRDFGPIYKKVENENKNIK